MENMQSWQSIGRLTLSTDIINQTSSYGLPAYDCTLMIGEVNFALDQIGYHDISSFLHLLLYGDISRKTLLG